MAKFKVGDRVKSKLDICKEWGVGTIVNHTSIRTERFTLNTLYDVNFDNVGLRNIQERELELVEAQEDKPSKVVYDYRGHNDVLDLIRGMMGATVIVDQKDYCDSILKDFAQSHNIDLRMYVDRSRNHFDKLLGKTSQEDKIKKAFERQPILDEAFGLTEAMKERLRNITPPKFKYLDDTLDAIRVSYHNILDNQVFWIGKNAFENKEVKNRIPDRVVFNQDKGKVTVLISKHMDGVAPYWAYTSKVHGDDKYDAIFGFLLAYFKYLNRSYDTKEQKAIIERVFKMPQTKRFPYLIGVVEQELLKHLGTSKKVEEIILAITSPNADMNYNNVTWDYLEWKEMLRVHEIETKREHEKAIRKEIKKHEQEIEKLKGKGDKK